MSSYYRREMILVYVGVLFMPLAGALQASQLFGIPGTHGFITQGISAASSLTDLLDRASNASSHLGLTSPRDRRLVLETLCEHIQPRTVPNTIEYHVAVRKELSAAFASDALTPPHSCGPPDTYLAVVHQASSAVRSCHLLRFLWGVATWDPVPQVDIVVHPEAAASDIMLLLGWDAGAFGCLTGRLRTYRYTQPPSYFMTWTHRALIEDAAKDSSQNYSFFGYSEDDNYLDGRRFARWKEDAVALDSTEAYARSYRHFYRYEYNSPGEQTFTDIGWHAPASLVRPYRLPPGPDRILAEVTSYCGMWLLTRPKLERFMSNRGPWGWNLLAWPETMFGIRERAAVGPLEPCEEDSSPEDEPCQNSLLPADPTETDAHGDRNRGFPGPQPRLSPDGGVWHISNSYVREGEREGLWRHEYGRPGTAFLARYPVGHHFREEEFWVPGEGRGVLPGGSAIIMPRPVARDGP